MKKTLKEILEIIEIRRKLNLSTIFNIEKLICCIDYLDKNDLDNTFLYLHDFVSRKDIKTISGMTDRIYIIESLITAFKNLEESVLAEKDNRDPIIGDIIEKNKSNIIMLEKILNAMIEYHNI